jgi:hypothetical protein
MFSRRAVASPLTRPAIVSPATAKALRFTIAPAFFARADEVSNKCFELETVYRGAWVRLWPDSEVSTAGPRVRLLR